MKKKIYHSVWLWLIPFLSISAIAFAQPSADFSASVTEGCSPLKVQFTDLSTGNPTSWLWDFGNGQTSTAKNPLVIYSSAGIYSVSETVKNGSITGNTVKTNYIIVDTLPQARFISKIAGCIPLVDTFTDQSIPGSGVITSWSWNFGDGSTSTAANPIHTYNTGGTYTVSLTIQNSKGCRDTLVVDTLIHTGTKPAASFTYPVLYTCASDPVRFNNKSTGTVTEWLWTFGDGDSSTKQNSLHYFHDTGYLKIILRAINNGCVDSFETKNLYVKPPIVKLRSIIACDSPYLRNFVAKYLGPTNFYWDFGDGTTSTDKYPIHTYADTGQYALKLFSFGTECNYTDSGLVTIVDEHPTINYNSSGVPVLCRYDTAKFVAANYNPANLTSFAWYFGDGDSSGTSTLNASSHVYGKVGTYPVSFIFKDLHECYDTTTNNINVYGPTAAVTNTVVTCIKNPVIFSDQSTTDGTNPISKWIWDFGDGTILTTSSPPFSHVYNTAGTFTIKLKVTDSVGCTDTVTKTNALMIVPKPVAAFSASDTLNCFSDSVSFRDNSQGSSLGLTWNFGDGATSTLATPVHTYAITGNYIVTLVIGNQVGCSDTLDKVVKVLPLPNVDAGTDSAICLGQSVILQATGANSYAWTADPSLSCVLCTNPVANPQTSKTYYVRGTDPFGCSASDSVFIEVRQPVTLSLKEKDTLCYGSSIQLIASGAEIYNWQPSTGLSNPTISNPVAKPTATTTYTVKGTDSKNCFADTASAIIIVAPYPQFNIIDTSIIINAGSTYLIKTTNSPDIIKWQWTPPIDLSCTDCPQPLTKGNKIIQYTAIASNSYGCSDSDKITIKALCNNGTIFIPNTFSPNGDGMNDHFYIRGPGLYLIKSMRIFNRLGQIVFEKTNFQSDDENAGWDGTIHSKKLAQDVYVYFIEVICNNGSVIRFTGNITLL